jgi:hypothetical protein
MQETPPEVDRPEYADPKYTDPKYTTTSPVPDKAPK